MRAHEILEEARWKDLLGPAALLAVSAGAHNLKQAGVKDPFGEVTSAQSAPSAQEDDGWVTAPVGHLPDEKAPEKPQAQPAQNEQAQLLALTMWGEARSHGESGMRAVGHVINNRMKSDRFGDEVKDVVWKRKAFSCWNKGDPNRAKMKQIAQMPKNSLEYKRFQMAKRIAREILANQSRDPTKGALFYHTTGVDPVWADPHKAVAQVANHVFYRTDRKA